ncbi:hypothetical protein C7I87_32935 [Mesorhizobium sp. SARCC-RB16n]|uniref:hypothetical protein n=1 Tax=Mesorhizobium sp. SARCC-RB16n TaxID=2116687 RepID=UPI00122EF7A5|nr:hypothetical protein [Mesorhizobium sp. SARCC-RB16n]KAA3441999.1 hypothetical protein C7I87_32935 [Mesorhizobium sp. SARCC-RB16n]
MTFARYQASGFPPSKSNSQAASAPAIAGDPNVVRESQVLDVLLTALDALRQSNVECCYWKSSRRLQAVLLGESDLDLLVARSDQHLAAQVLLACGFKRFDSVPCRSHPAIQSFLGYDEPSGRIVHLHIHFRLVVGERLLRNYQLPWEQLILASTIPHPTLPIRVLDPTSEALLLLVRASLEFRRRDPIALRDWRATQEKFELDRLHLAPHVDSRGLRDLAAKLVKDDLAEAIAGAMSGPQPLATQHRLHRHVRKDLAVYRTYNTTEVALRRISRVILWTVGSLNKRFFQVPRPWGRHAPGGGIVVAVVGIDGSGKTTLVTAIRQWLGSEVDVLPIYFGTGGGKPSLLLLPFKLLVPLATLALGTKPAGSSHGTVSGRAPGPFYSILLAIWATVVAWEKLMKLVAARRGADRGMVVIADRFPQDEIGDFNDAPLLPRLAKVPTWLRRFEADAYAFARRLPPDLVIKLQTSSEVIMSREPDMDPLVVQKRVPALQRLTFRAATVVSVDAGQPLVDVIRAAKAAIWRML